jgi:hypothetical protein
VSAAGAGEDVRTGRADGWTRAMLVLIVAVPLLFNAVALWPEVREAVPSVNDDAVHYLLIQRASEALERGENPVDHWVADLELGFPEFLYYQHLPHLTVVLLHRLLLKSVSLLTLFNLVRYLLLVGFPLTVFWSLRRMGFSAVAASAAAAASTLIFSPGYGIEFNSYVWRGLGMYTQLWAIHLALLSVACLHTVLYRGRGYVAAILACSALGLSHLIYSYIVAVAAVVMFIAGLKAGNLRARIGRLAAVGGIAGVIGSYLVVPLVLAKPFASTSVYLESWKPNSFGARVILGRLVNGEMLDAQRLPVLTVLLALGVVAAVTARKGPARLVLGIFTAMLLLSFGRVTWGRIVDLFPMGHELHFSRFIGATQLLAIPLVGLGAEWLWRLGTGRSDRWRAAVFGLGALAVLAVPLVQLRPFYEVDAQWMRRTREAIGADLDAQAVVAALKALPPGRTYAGLRTNWGNAPSMRFGHVAFTDLLTFHRIVAVSPPYQSFSLTSDLIWHFDDANPAHYDLFDVRYVVAPTGQAMARFLKPLKVTARYTLYEAATRGYGAFVSLNRAAKVRQQANLFFLNRDWFVGLQPGGGLFVREEYPASRDDSWSLAQEGCPAGTIRENRAGPGLFDLSAECSHASTMLLKTTYHPNWRVTVDGAPVKTFMVSPGFIGFPWPAGAHRVRAEYRSTRTKSILLVLGAVALVATVGLRRRFTRFEEWL